MAEDYPSELEHVGRALAQHRANLGVSLGALVTAFGPGNDRLAKFVERARHPALHLIEAHHKHLIEAWKETEVRANPPAAMREQWYATPDDYRMREDVMATRPKVVWWWGARGDLGARGAWCYLCNTLIYRYDIGRGATRAARFEIMAHRYKHITNPAAIAGDIVIGSYL